MSKCFSGAFLWLLMTAWLTAAGVREGMTREEAEAEAGKPLSVLKRGETTVLRYPNDGRVELKDGRVTRVVRVRHAADPATPEEIAAEEASMRAKAEAEAKKKEAAEEAAAAAESAELARLNTETRKETEAAVERLTAEHEAGPGVAAGMPGFGQSPSQFWTLLAVGALVQVGVGMVILKLAFKWADVHAEWLQMLWPALAGMAGSAVVRGVGYAAFGATEFFRMDDAVSYLALLTALFKTTHACTLQRVLAVGSAAKLMTIVVWTFLSVALSQMLFA